MQSSHQASTTENPIRNLDRLQKLPDGMLFFAIGKFMSDSDVQQLALGSKTMHSIFYPKKLLDKFLQGVAFGNQDKVEQLFRDVYSGHPVKIQEALCYQGVLTDYSGRTFNCSAYEYAYWAKDAHMCRMLEAHMDENTKAQIFTWIDAIDARGLSYQQNGETHHSKHFDFTPLKTALQAYVNDFIAWHDLSDWDSIEAAWRAVGMAQRDVPAHVAQEYCRPDRRFDPTHERLPRVLTVVPNDSWFPLSADNTGPGSMPGGGAGIRRGCGDGARARRVDGGGPWPRRGKGRWYTVNDARQDLLAIIRLDEVRTADLELSREHLSSATSLRMGG